MYVCGFCFYSLCRTLHFYFIFIPSNLPFISTELFVSNELKVLPVGLLLMKFSECSCAPFIFILYSKNGLVARTIFTVWGFGHQGRLVHHLGSLFITPFVQDGSWLCTTSEFLLFFLVRTGFYTFDKKPFPANFVSQNQVAACLEPSGWSNMKYYLTGLLLGKDLFSQALSPVPKCHCGIS